MMRMPALHSAALLLLLLPGTLTHNNLDSDLVPIYVVVKNSLLDTPAFIYTTHVATRGILLGALKRLMHSNADFKFTYKDNPNYGPYLLSVNGLAGNNQDKTYWELLVVTPDGGLIIPNIGIGCYIPRKHDTIILNFKRW
ncbi:transcobalamin-1-like [Xiphias gladius]|uniref:transcobalamin-1-like n=1 Tax=Xiphias gladius TaxID=8245 RepID=UPI001A99F70B|nr:transcobalamin-1-like [Xiphias gladius]